MINRGMQLWITPSSASVPIPKFATPCGPLLANFGIEKDTSKFTILVWFLDLKFLYDVPPNHRNFKSITLGSAQILARIADRTGPDGNEFLEGVWRKKNSWNSPVS
jgi:hypothetical protein